MAYGLFTDAGSDQSGNTNYDVLHLNNGDVRITHPNSKTEYSDFHINDNTCYATITIQGAYTLGHGSDAYRGIHGHGTYNAKIKAVFPMSGGSCNGASAPIGETGVINGHGPAFRPSTL